MCVDAAQRRLITPAQRASTSFTHATCLPPQIIRFVEGRMGNIAPNLSAAIGSEVAARLMGVAGGLLALSRIPACNIQVRKRRGMSVVRE